MPADLVSTLRLERFKCRGDEALAEWARLKDEGMGWPVIVGDDRDLERLVETIDDFAPTKTPEELLLAAERTRFPEELRDKHQARLVEIVEVLKRDLLLPDDALGRRWKFVPGKGDVELSVEETRSQIRAEIDAGGDIPVGDWPTEHRSSTTQPLQIHRQGKYLDSVNILRVPVGTGPDVLAHLRWVVVNEWPETRIHIAALRRWHEMYGAELVALTESSVTLYVPRHPKTREDAIALVREQMLYCPLSVDVLAPIAFDMMTSDWWLFWWD